MIRTAAGKRGITGSTLKWIAILTMLIDHTAAIILQNRLLRLSSFQARDAQELAAVKDNFDLLYPVYQFMRNIPGRIAFPIFCFLLVQGFIHTRSPRKYAVRLFLFALLSEVPFDLGFHGELFSWRGQNVLFTLFLGLLVIAGFRYFEERQGLNPAASLFCRAVILAAGMAAAFLLKTDYNMYGVLTVAVMYQLRSSRVLSAGAGCAVLALMSQTELGAFLSVLPIALYNGKRGSNIKWLFYVFYPLHILILYLIACALGVMSPPVL